MVVLPSLTKDNQLCPGFCNKWLYSLEQQVNPLLFLKTRHHTKQRDVRVLWQSALSLQGEFIISPSFYRSGIIVPFQIGVGSRVVFIIINAINYAIKLNAPIV